METFKENDPSDEFKNEQKKADSVARRQFLKTFGAAALATIAGIGAEKILEGKPESQTEHTGEFVVIDKKIEEQIQPIDTDGTLIFIPHKKYFVYVHINGKGEKLEIASGDQYDQLNIGHKAKIKYVEKIYKNSEKKIEIEDISN